MRYKFNDAKTENEKYYFTISWRDSEGDKIATTIARNEFQAKKRLDLFRNEVFIFSTKKGEEYSPENER